jgi:hypothetical protein
MRLLTTRLGHRLNKDWHSILALGTLLCDPREMHRLRFNPRTAELLDKAWKALKDRVESSTEARIPSRIWILPNNSGRRARKNVSLRQPAILRLHWFWRDWLSKP